MKKIIISIIVLLFIGGSSIGGYFLLKVDEEEPKNEVTDGERFAEEYSELTKDNVYVYRTISETVKILDNGSGIVYLGFPECPWCQAYVPFLNDVAKENGISKVYYTNILKDRTDNTEDYQKITELLGDFSEYDDEGNKRIYAPTVIFVKDGEILGMDSETAKDTKGYNDPNDYWTEKEIEDLKERLDELCKKVNNVTCSDCNE